MSHQQSTNTAWFVDSLYNGETALDELTNMLKRIHRTRFPTSESHNGILIGKN